MADQERKRRGRRRFTPEFKRDAVELVRMTGRPIAQIAAELGIYDSTLGNWVRQAQIDQGELEGLTSDDKARLCELEAENAKLRMERDLAQTNRGLLGQGDVDTVSRYRCVDARKAERFPVAAACEAAGVSTSAYYAWAAKHSYGRSAAERQEAELLDEIRTIHQDSGGVYGSPRVTAELRRHGRTVNHKRVERLMRAHGIVGYRPRRRRCLTRPDAGVAPAPDLLGRLFDPDQPNLAWCGDVTWIPTDQGWLYLASVIDLASRHLLGWSMGQTHDARLVTDALDAAVATRARQRMPATIFHTDRGAAYTSAACQAACERLGLRQSMSRTGSCLDNAAAESFFATLKVELVGRRRYATRAEARASIFAWIAWYNRRRLHSTIGYRPPVEWEQHHAALNPLPSTMAA